MFPTLCALAGAELPKGVAFDGIDLSNTLRGTRVARRQRPLMWEYGRNAKFFNYPKSSDDRSPNLAIRDGNWKLLVNAEGEHTELYHLPADRGEAKNMAEVHPEIVARLQKALLDWRKSMPSITAAPSN
jgi:arylsulfatase A-like enzyme